MALANVSPANSFSVSRCMRKVTQTLIPVPVSHEGPQQKLSLILRMVFISGFFTGRLNSTSINISHLLIFFNNCKQPGIFPMFLCGLRYVNADSELIKEFTLPVGQVEISSWWQVHYSPLQLPTQVLLYQDSRTVYLGTSQSEASRKASAFESDMQDSRKSILLSLFLGSL